jgi:hypothetical protein
VHAEALMGLALEQGFAVRGEQGRTLRGWALAMQGDSAEGIIQISHGLAAHQRVGGPELGRPFVLALMAEAYGQARQPEAGLQALSEALTRVEATEERWGAELYRLKGALLLQLPIPDVLQAEACSWHRSTAGSPKALSRLTCRRLGRCWRSCHDG